jgi:hypothetical protein
MNQGNKNGRELSRPLPYGITFGELRKDQLSAAERYKGLPFFFVRATGLFDPSE